MTYLLFIYENEAANAQVDPAAMGAMMAEYGKFTQEIQASGHYKGGHALQPTSDATTVRVRDGKTVTTDGPFAETREQLGGYYLVEAAHLDDAIAIAAKVPGAKYGSIEIRPVMTVAQA